MLTTAAFAHAHDKNITDSSVFFFSPDLTIMQVVEPFSLIHSPQKIA